VLRARGPGPSQSKCYFRFLGWILAEICLKCIILVTNFQKLPSAGGSSPPAAPLNLQHWWPEITWFGKIVCFKLIMRKSNFKKSVWRHFSDVIATTSPKWRHKNFAFWAPPQSKFLATPVLHGEWYIWVYLVFEWDHHARRSHVKVILYLNFYLAQKAFNIILYFNIHK